jgi:hypothetical protein
MYRILYIYIGHLFADLLLHCFNVHAFVAECRLRIVTFGVYVRREGGTGRVGIHAIM